MKMFCICDRIDTGVGLRVAGIDYMVAKDREEILKKVEDILKDETIGIVGVTNKIYYLAQDKFDEIQVKRKTPLIVKIPS